MVSSGCKLGSLLVGRAWFSSIGVGSNCIGGGPIESSVGGIPVQAVNRTVHPSKWYLGRWVLLGVGVSLGDGFSSACVEALVGVRHSGGFLIAWALSVSIAWALSVSTAVSSVYRRSLCCSGLSILPWALSICRFLRVLYCFSIDGLCFTVDGLCFIAIDGLWFTVDGLRFIAIDGLCFVVSVVCWCCRSLVDTSRCVCC